MSDTNPPAMLSLDLNTLETSLPVIRGDKYELRIKESEIIQPDDPTKAPAWKLTLETLGPTMDINGKPVEPGHLLFTQTQLRPTGRANWKMVAQNIASIIQALRPRIDGQLALPIDPWHKQVEGKIVRVSVVALPARDKNDGTGTQYRPSNRVDEWFKN